MSGKRVLLLCLAAVAAFAALTCQNQDSPVSLLDPQFARKPKPEPVEEPKLEEFWVVQGDPDVLHVVWSGGGTVVDPSVAWDHFFNGIHDDDFPVDDHYEYQMFGPPEAKGTLTTNGWRHADISWNGGRHEDGSYPYPNFPATEIPGEGDPFSFRLTFLDDDGMRVGGAVPFGVVVGGNNEFGEILPADVVTSVVGNGHDENLAVRSYATFAGAPRTGTISITELSMPSVSCKARTVKVNGERLKQVLVSGEVTVNFTKDPPITLEYGEYIWWEGRFLDEDTGAISSRLHLSGSGTYSIGRTMPPGWTGGSVSFVVDYVVSSASLTSTTDPLNHETASYYVYDPSLNATGVITTAGFSDLLWADHGPSSAVNDGKFPVAHTEAYPLNCG